MDIIENSHITPAAIVGICGTLLNKERAMHTLDRKKAVGEKVRSSSPAGAVWVMVTVPNIPTTAKTVTITNSKRNLRTIHRKIDFPCAEITSNI